MLWCWAWLPLTSTPNMLALPELSSATKPRALGLEQASNLVAALTVTSVFTLQMLAGHCCTALIAPFPNSIHLLLLRRKYNEAGGSARGSPSWQNSLVGVECAWLGSLQIHSMNY